MSQYVSKQEANTAAQARLEIELEEEATMPPIQDPKSRQVNLALHQALKAWMELPEKERLPLEEIPMAEYNFGAVLYGIKISEPTDTHNQWCYVVPPEGNDRAIVVIVIENPEHLGEIQGCTAIADGSLDAKPEREVKKLLEDIEQIAKPAS